MTGALGTFFAFLGFAWNCFALLALLCFAWCCIALICFALLCIALHFFAVLCITLHCFALLGFALLCFAFLGFAVHCFALLCFVLPWFALHCSALLCFALHCIALLCFAMMIANQNLAWGLVLISFIYYGSHVRFCYCYWRLYIYIYIYIYVYVYEYWSLWNIYWTLENSSSHAFVCIPSICMLIHILRHTFVCIYMHQYTSVTDLHGNMKYIMWMLIHYENICLHSQISIICIALMRTYCNKNYPLQYSYLFSCDLDNSLCNNNSWSHISNLLLFL